jgi:uncharacterized PurR-regulated membrane protein YhhQ (DUF165 family)
LPNGFGFASVGGYFVKLIIAIGLTPLIYLGHYLIDNYLGTEKNGN